MRVRCLAFALAVTLALSASAANAGIVLTFNDQPPSSSVTVAGGSAMVNMVGPDNFLVVLPSGTLPAPASINEVYGLTMPGTPGYSDLVYFMSLPNSTGLIVDFVGDPTGSLIPAKGSTLYGSATAAGGTQGIPLPSDLAGVALTVQVGTSLNGPPPPPQAVPEPSFMALAGTGGLMGLGFWGYRRRQASVARKI